MASNGGRFLEGLVVGGLFGFIFGILTAPKSGSELRKELADNSEDLYKHASDSLHDFRGKTEHAIEDLKAQSDQVIKKASNTVQNTKDQMASRLQDMAGKSTKVLIDDVESATSGG